MLSSERAAVSPQLEGPDALSHAGAFWCHFYPSRHLIGRSTALAFSFALASQASQSQTVQRFSLISAPHPSQGRGLGGGHTHVAIMRALTSLATFTARL